MPKEIAPLKQEMLINSTRKIQGMPTKVAPLKKEMLIDSTRKIQEKINATKENTKKLDKWFWDVGIKILAGIEMAVIVSVLSVALVNLYPSVIGMFVIAVIFTVVLIIHALWADADRTLFLSVIIEKLLNIRSRNDRDIGKQAVKEIKALEAHFEHVRGDPIVESTISHAADQIAAMLETAKGRKYLLRESNARLQKIRASRQQRMKREHECVKEIEKAKKAENERNTRAYLKAREYS